MLMRYEFAPGKWEHGLIYAYSYRFPGAPVFVQQADHVHNRKISEERFGYDNISVMTRETYGSGAKVSTTCSFDSFGAPLITIADALHEEADGSLRYGEYFEIVLYENGINVWRMHMDAAKNVTWHKALGVEFPVAAGEKHLLSVEIREKTMVIRACGQQITLYAEDMPERFHVGIDACEGINRFYDFTIEA